MKLTNLEEASERDVRKWLEESLQLSDYQKEKLRIDEIIRFAPYEFYERKMEKISLWWRFTLPFVPIYIVLAYLAVLIKLLVTGEQGLGRRFEKFHRGWFGKLKL